MASDAHQAGPGLSHSQPFKLGLTGSVGMGKTAVSNMFRQKGVPVLDADEVVHRLYAAGGAAVPVVQRLFPSAIVDNAVNRPELAKCVLNDQEAMARLEAVVHPLVTASRLQFLAEQSSQGSSLVVFDIPLLYEKNLVGEVDAVVVVSASEAQQRQRVLSRGWTEEKLQAILALQVPDAEKRSRANYIIDTSTSFEATDAQVQALVEKLTATHK